MPDIKHVGRMKKSRAKVAVAYRTLPGNSSSALVIETTKLDAPDHDALISVIESNRGQTSFELYEALQRSNTPDGQNMLVKFHQSGSLAKVSTSEVEMIPNTDTVISLDELNEMIAKQKGVTVDQLAVQPTAQATPVATSQVANIPTGEQPLTDEQLAARMRSDADRLYKEAARLRTEAEELSPTKTKKSK
jgi:hypothetical protein